LQFYPGHYIELGESFTTIFEKHFPFGSQTPPMNRLFCCLLLLLSLQSQCQSTDTTLGSKAATVNVKVTNLQLKPQKGEQVIFRGTNTGAMINGFSDAAGKLTVTLPQGDDYVVSLKAISDTTKYAMIKVPLLKEDEYFTDPFVVTIKFQLARSYRLDNVHFDVDKATLRSDSYAQLNELLEYLQRHPEIKVEIAGHTDNTGADAHNLQLSQERSNTIRNYLVKKGIKVTQVIAKGYGSKVPVADNATEEGRQLNRRTEVRIL
jgi:OOP family OmpA-OmpF porin